MIAYAKPLAAVAAFSLAVWAAYSHGRDSKQAEWDAAKVAEADAKSAALEAAASAIAKIEVTSEKIVQPIRTEIRTNTVYRDCQHSPDSLRNLNALIVGGEPDGQGRVPQTDTAD